MPPLAPPVSCEVCGRRKSAKIFSSAGIVRLCCSSRRSSSEFDPAGAFRRTFRSLFDPLFALVAWPNSRRDFRAATRYVAECGLFPRFGCRTCVIRGGSLRMSAIRASDGSFIAPNHTFCARIEKRRTRRSAAKRMCRPKFRAVFEKFRRVRETGSGVGASARDGRA